MTANSKFGVQPAREILTERGYSLNRAAELLPENRSHLRNAVLGIVSPCERLRESLPRLLDTRLEELFTQESLSSQYGSGYTSAAPVPRRTREQMLKDAEVSRARRELDSQSHAQEAQGHGHGH